MTTRFVCSIAGCARPVRARGWCSPHYQRWRQYGTPTGGGTAQGEPMAFLLAAARSDSTGCIEWPYSRGADGRGQIWDGKRVVLAHRLVCEIVHGPAPFEKAEAAHGCGNGHLGCVTPRHLRWSDHAENMAEKFAHGTVVRGKDNGSTRLTQEVVRTIRTLLGTLSERRIAKRFHVSPTTIGNIRSGKTWGWLA